MWFLPSYGRPEALKRLASAPGGMPQDTLVLVNADDPMADLYAATSPWQVEYIPAGSRCGDAWRWMYDHHRSEGCYGMICDDNFPRTAGWYTILQECAGQRYLAYCNGKNTEFPLMRGVCCFGGDLVRQLGGVVPPGYRHNYIDCVMHVIADDNGLLRPLPEVFVDHNHWLFDHGVTRDETYARGSADQPDDAARYHAFLNSRERQEIKERLARWLSA